MQNRALSAILNVMSLCLCQVQEGPYLFFFTYSAKPQLVEGVIVASPQDDDVQR